MLFRIESLNNRLAIEGRRRGDQSLKLIFHFSGSDPKRDFWLLHESAARRLVGAIQQSQIDVLGAFSDDLALAQLQLLLVRGDNVFVDLHLWDIDFRGSEVEDAEFSPQSINELLEQIQLYFHFPNISFFNFS